MLARSSMIKQALDTIIDLFSWHHVRLDYWLTGRCEICGYDLTDSPMDEVTREIKCAECGRSNKKCYLVLDNEDVDGIRRRQ